MKYYISKTVRENFESVQERIPELLQQEGFGILTEIDVQKTMKNKLDLDFKKYIILGACNPHLAHQAFVAEDKIGTLLPCNVILIEQGEGLTEVTIIDPLAAMSQIGNKGLEGVAQTAAEKLGRVLDKL